MSYVIYNNQPGVGTAQAAEARSELFWPTVKLGTFGQVQEVQVPGPAYFPKSPCGVCRAAAAAAEQAAKLQQGTAGFGVAGAAGMSAGTLGKVVAGASAVVSLTLLVLTLRMGKRR